MRLYGRHFTLQNDDNIGKNLGNVKRLANNQWLTCTGHCQFISLDLLAGALHSAAIVLQIKREVITLEDMASPSER